MTNINILVALAAEAKPLIQHYQLKKIASIAGIHFYHNNNINLIVSGLGQLNMATACGLTFGRQAETAIWINCGLSAHSSASLGTVFACHKITDQLTGRYYYPPMNAMSHIASDNITCSQLANFDYGQAGLLDMESFAFYQYASRFSEGELVQCLKVVSDNPQNPGQQLKPADAERLMTTLIPALDQSMEQLSLLAEQLYEKKDTSADMSRCLQQWHFSKSREHQLQQLLNRWNILLGEKPFNIEQWSSCRSAKQFLTETTAYLDQCYAN